MTPPPAAVEPPILDGHNDLLCRLWLAGGRRAVAGFRNGRKGAIDLPRARAGGFAGGLFAVYTPSPGPSPVSWEAMNRPSYDLPLDAPLAAGAAVPVVLGQAAILFDLERTGEVAVCRSVREIRAALAANRMAAVFHLEGADAIDPELHLLDVLHQAGLRSLGPVWSRNNRFGHGVPFRFPSTPDIGAGLTGDGIRLVRRCDELGILIDLSHLNERGFRDVARHSRLPLVATHSNAHALCPHSRNLTDEQLAMIRDTDGMVGLNLAVAFLRPDGRMLGEAPLSLLLRHLDYLLERLGEDRVGLGSDYEGAVVPTELASVADLPRLRQAMVAHGYDDGLISRICHGNWLRILERIWGE